MYHLRLAAVAGLALLLPACGDDGGSASGATTTALPTTTAPSSTSSTEPEGSTTTATGERTTTTVGGTLLKKGTAKMQLSNGITATIDAALVPGSGRYRSRYEPPPGQVCLTWRDEAKNISMEIHAHPGGCGTSFAGSTTTSDKLKVWVYTKEPNFIFVSEKGECRLSMEAGGASGAELQGSVDCAGVPATGLFDSGETGSVDVKGTFTAAP